MGRADTFLSSGPLQSNSLGKVSLGCRKGTQHTVPSGHWRSPVHGDEQIRVSRSAMTLAWSACRACRTASSCGEQVPPGAPWLVIVNWLDREPDPYQLMPMLKAEPSGISSAPQEPPSLPMRLSKSTAPSAASASREAVPAIPVLVKPTPFD